MNIKNINKDKLLVQKKKYAFLLTIMVLGVLAGILFVFFISSEDKTLLLDNLNGFFTSIKENKLNYTDSLINSISGNLLSILLIWLLGISVIGIPFILCFLVFKCFVLGFSISSILVNYGFKGIFVAFSYVFPHQLLYLVMWLLLSFYALSFFFFLFRLLFLKKNINLKEHFRKYLKILLICLLSSCLVSLFEVYVTPQLIKLFIF